MNYIINISKEKSNTYVLDKFKKYKVNYQIKDMKLGHFNINSIIDNRASYFPNITIYLYEFNEFLNLLLEEKENYELNVFFRTLKRLTQAQTKTIIIIDDVNWYLKVLSGDYEIKVETNTEEVKEIVMTLEARFKNISIIGLDKKVIASYINTMLYYHLKTKDMAK